MPICFDNGFEKNNFQNPKIQTNNAAENSNQPRIKKIINACSQAIFTPHHHASGHLPNYSKSICGGVHRNWEKDFIEDPNLAKEKMEKKLLKAIQKNIADLNSDSENPYIDPNQINAQLLGKTKSHSLEFDIGSAEIQGQRDSMEDQHFYTPFKEGVLAGVFDGHGGKDVAVYACNHFQWIFPKILKKNKNNVHKSFEETFAKIQSEIIKNRDFDMIGSTAVIFLLLDNRAYVATLGDSEANNYRMIDEKCISIPLSCVRNWRSKKDSQRAENATINEFRFGIIDWWKKNYPYPRSRRLFPHAKVVSSKYPPGINVSRAFGDHAFNMERPNVAVIAKPLTTAANVKPGDTIVIACDGLKAIKESLICKQIQQSYQKSAQEISNDLVALAGNEMSADNVTVITIKIKEKRNFFKELKSKFS